MTSLIVMTTLPPLWQKKITFLGEKMEINELQRRIETLCRIRDILLEAGIRSDQSDQTLQRICNDIDNLYQQVLNLGER